MFRHTVVVFALGYASSITLLTANCLDQIEDNHMACWNAIVDGCRDFVTTNCNATNVDVGAAVVPPQFNSTVALDVDYKQNLIPRQLPFDELQSQCLLYFYTQKLGHLRLQANDCADALPSWAFQEQQRHSRERPASTMPELSMRKSLTPPKPVVYHTVLHIALLVIAFSTIIGTAAVVAGRRRQAWLQNTLHPGRTSISSSFFSDVYDDDDEGVLTTIDLGPGMV